MEKQPLPDWAGSLEDIKWLDSDNAVTLTYRQGGNGLSGLLHWHRRDNENIPTATPGWCVGGIHFDANGWTLESLEPLTVSPSLLCGACGSHGFIRNGIWVKA